MLKNPTKSLACQFEHDVETVFELMTDPDFLVDRSLDLGDLGAECEVEDDGDKTIVRMTREIERDLPSLLAKVISGKQTMELEECWQSLGDNKVGTYTARIAGQPMSLSARFSLNATDSGCEYLVEHRARVKIPLIGSKVEKYITSQIGSEVGKELDYVKNKLG